MFKVGDTVKTKCDGRVGVVTLVWSFGGSIMIANERLSSEKIKKILDIINQ